MMVRRSVCVALCAVAAIASVPSAEARPGSLISITDNGVAAGTGTMVRIDPNTGHAEAIAVLEGPGLALAFNDRDGLLYGSILLRDPVEGNRTLLSIVDPNTGDVSDIGFVTEPNGEQHVVAGMGFTADGRLYGVSRHEYVLLEIDPHTGDAFRIGDGLGMIVGTNGATILGDTFYFLSGTIQKGQYLYTVDLETGLAELVGYTGVMQSSVGVAVDGRNRLLAVIHDSLYELDPLTGVASLIGYTGFTALSSLEFVDTLHSACPCDADWRNHGEYVSCVARASTSLPPGTRGAINEEAARSDCGR